MIDDDDDEDCKKNATLHIWITWQSLPSKTIILRSLTLLWQSDLMKDYSTSCSSYDKINNISYKFMPICFKQVSSVGDVPSTWNASFVGLMHSFVRQTAVGWLLLIEAIQRRLNVTSHLVEG